MEVPKRSGTLFTARPLQAAGMNMQEIGWDGKDFDRILTVFVLNPFEFLETGRFRETKGAAILF